MITLLPFSLDFFFITVVSVSVISRKIRRESQDNNIAIC